MELLSYQEFLFETYAKIKFSSAKENLLRSISNNYLNENEKVVFNFLINEGFTEDIFYLHESGYEAVYEENLFTKFKEKYQNAKELIKQKGKEALDTMSDATKKVLELGGNIMKAVQIIIQKVAQVIKTSFEASKAKAKESVDKASDKITEKLESMKRAGDKKVSVKDETSHVGEMIAAGTKYVTSGYVEQLAGASKEAATKDGESKKESTYISYLQYSIINEIASDINHGTSIYYIIESLNEDGESLNESGDDSGGLNIPYLSKLMDKIGKIPPFSLFHKLGDLAGKFSNNMLSKTSFYIHKIADGPTPYKFVAYGVIVGIIVGYEVEHKITHLLALLPGIGILFSIMSGIGTALAIYGMVKAFVGQDEKGEEK